MSLFKKIFGKQPIKKGNWKGNCNYIAKMGGYKFYAYKSVDLMPIHRHSLITDLLQQNAKKLTKNEQGILIDGLVEYCQKMVNTYNEKKRVEYIDSILWCALELKGRNDELMFHPELMLEIVAYSVIREDEDPVRINDEIHQEKMDLFKKEGGDIPFYLQVGLAELFPNWSGSIKQSKELLALHNQIIEKRNLTYKKLTGLDQSTEADSNSNNG